jgi:microcystin-dependent protein
MSNKTMRRTAMALAVVLGGALSGAAVAGGLEPYVGEIMWVPYNFAPRGWATCDGQLIAISQNTALFSLLGTTFGGDGRSTFALPNMQGRLLVQAGQGPGLSPYGMGQMDGEENHTLLVSEMPAHSHVLYASDQTATQASPNGGALAKPASGNLYGTNADTTLAPAALATQGGNQPHNNMMPYMALTCIIALQGVFPPRP